MKKIIVALCFLIHVQPIKSAQQQEKVQPFATHGLLVFLDTSTEKGDKIGVFSDRLLAAVGRKAGPILTSGLLLRNIIKYPAPGALVAKKVAEEDADADDYQKELEYYEQFQKAVAGAFASSQDPQAIITAIKAATEPFAKKLDEAWPQLKESFVKVATPFNPDDWVIKQVNPHLLLLVPNDYLASVEKLNLALYYKTTAFSKRELNLGIKIDHMQTIKTQDFDSFIDAYTAPEEDSSDTFFVDFLKDIFITRAEYARDSAALYAFQPQWVIYLGGHGLSGKYIADLTLDAFKTLLEFLDTRIYTKLLVYSSCYAAGVSAEKVYQDNNLPFFKTFSFPIVSGALTDAGASVKWSSVSFADIKPEDLDFARRTLKPRDPFNFAQFLRETAAHDSLDLPKVLELILVGAQDISTTRHIFSLPQLKLPGIPWFNVVDTHNKVVSLGRILAASRGSDQPLNIMTFFKRTAEPMGILLYANVIPFELQIPLKTMPLLISMVPGDTAHKIKKISVETTFKQFAESFKPLERMHPKKLFWIEELEVTGITQPTTPKTTLKDVIIELTNGKLEYHLTRDVVAYTWDATKSMLSPLRISYIDKTTKEPKKIKKTPEFEAALNTQVVSPQLTPDLTLEAVEKIRKAQEFKIEQIRQAQEHEEKIRKEDIKQNGD